MLKPQRTKAFAARSALFPLMLVAVHARAEYRFDVWTADSGLPQNSVRAIVQTREGYLWVGTLDGLARFDGVRFTVFNKANSPGLSGNRITALYADPEGDLWVGLDSGGIARHHSGRFTSFGIGEGYTAEPIAMISGDERGNPLVCVGRSVFQWKEDRFEPAFPETFSSAAIAGRRGGILWAIVEGELQILSRGKLTTLSASTGLPSMQIKGVDADQYGNWWVAMENSLVKVRDGKVAKIFTHQDGLPPGHLFPRQVPHIGIDPIACEDRKGNVWISGAGSWLGRLKDGAFASYPSSNTLSSRPLPLATPGVASGYIKEFFEDREGNLWIGTEGSGLIRAREQIVNVISTGQGLHAANIYPVYEDRAGAVWIGSWFRGPARLKSGELSNFDLERDTTAFCEDRAGRLWVGSIGRVGIFQDGELSVASVPVELANQTISAICEDQNGVLWFGAEGGLFSYQNGNLRLFSEREGVLGFVSVIMEDRNGSLWIGSRGGLTRLVNGRFTTWTEKDGLPGNRVTALYEDDERTLWIGTSDSGLGRFRDGRFTSYTTGEGMFDNGVFQILEDQSGNFWMSCNRGIHRVSKRELNEFAEGRRRSITSIAYGKSDGMLNPECNGGRSPAGIKTRDGKLWFPTQDGVAVIDPAALPTNPRPPPAVIEAFVLDRQPQPLDRPLRVPPGKAGNIEIQYSGLSFVNSERIGFKYRLTPADEDWVEAGTRRAAYYSHIAPGHYTFTVLAANSDGVWGETGASLGFVIVPAWYQTGWFHSLVFVAVAGSAFGAYRWRVNLIERRRAAQESFSRELIQQQEAERKRIAADLHDGLGQALLVIKNTAALATDPGAAPDQLRGDLASITRLSADALDEVRAITHALRPPELDRLGLTKALEHAVSLAADSGGLKCSVQIEPLEGLLSPSSEIQLYRVVQECLNNVVKHARAGFVEVRVWRDGHELRASVTDNGEGFDPAHKRSGIKERGGHGLTGMTERVRLLGGDIAIRSQPGSGTTVEARLPLEANCAETSKGA